ncbi:Neuronal acetylcholine receptor subunit alpha [Seminavis robusta]|uniref:Neuronal acetylcholine receptor subunit alpha n=1 Tax=Seminavis robusta TaxID=568900 RepID=A0A9N8E786_9STRA|nr:Neuronal acetylcholine receptor subunit alpha [Seminavis robusta]|eukprot:Sro755_g197650.1 Neuronal acetylcholine receptor subunit alpha (611) ;mRNA; r:35364-37287
MSVPEPPQRRKGAPIPHVPTRQNVEHRRIQAETHTSSITIPSDSVFGDVRSLQEEHNSSMCSICHDSTVIDDLVPFYLSSEEAGIPSNLTCGEWEQLAQSSLLRTDDDCDSWIRNFYSQCCEGSVPVYQCESNIRHQILEHYDPAVPPIVSPRSPIDVTVTLSPNAVEKIDVQTGTARIMMSLLMEWKDARLTWEPTEDTCAGSVALWAGYEKEKTEVWVPDIDMYNQVEGLQTMPDTLALVNSNGMVSWRRNGGVTVFCQFTGLSQIPFDMLGCQIIVGPWVRQSSNQIRYQLFNGTGLQVGPFEGTFNEYLPVPELSESGTAFGGGVMYFNLYYRRAQAYYVNNLLIPTVVLTYVSMGTYLLDLRVGERLSYGMALALVVVAQQIATGGMIPISNERLWIDKFIGWSFYWIILGLVESVAVGYLYFFRKDKAEKGESSPEQQQQQNPVYNDMKVVPETEEQGQSNGGPKSEFFSTRSRQPQQSTRGEDRSIVLNERNSTVVDCDNLASYLEEGMISGAGGGHAQDPLTSDHNNGTTQFATFKQQLQDHPSESWMYTVSLRRIDRFFFFFTLVTYTIFIIVMFASRPYWGRNLKNVWLHQGDASWDSDR